jgi:hypothetical protein
MKFRVMKNAEIKCLKLLASTGRITPLTIANKLWPGSRQPLKKTLTIRRHLRVLVRYGFVRNYGDAYEATETGRLAAKDASEMNRPLMLGLAG